MPHVTTATEVDAIVSELNTADEWLTLVADRLAWRQLLSFPV